MADGMRQFRVRVGRVRRHGGADVKVIDGKFDWHGQARPALDALELSAGRLQEFFPDLAGFAIVGWDPRGRVGTGFINTMASPVPMSRLVSFVSEALHTDIITNNVIGRLNGGSG